MSEKQFIKKEKPPKWIWDKAHELFDLDDNIMIYTYGNCVFDPGNHTTQIPDSILQHEFTHSEQQYNTKGGPDEWWTKYFEDPEFRKSQELQAYQKQYSHFCTKERDRNRQSRYLNEIARHASSKIYKMNLDFSEAVKLIRNKK